MKEVKKEQQQTSMLIHLVAGGLAGTTGAILTSPLEVVKTRFQSSSSILNLKEINSFKTLSNKEFNGVNILPNNLNIISNNSGNNVNSSCKSNSFQQNFKYSLFKKTQIHTLQSRSSGGVGGGGGGGGGGGVSGGRSLGTTIYYNLKYIIQNEGYGALFKGLGPTVVGVAPYRAIYFFAYANSKNIFRNILGTNDEPPLLHICSAFIAGFTAVSITNPIWFVKTRLQLDETRRGLSTFEVVNKIFKEKGPLGFYKGISASYFGVAESAIYFVLYEKLKKISVNHMTDQDGLAMLTYFSSAGFAKTLASCLCYPHEVARTRLREEGSKYTGFFQTLNLIIKEEGVRGMYKGMATHLIRQIPNTAIVMTTYEVIVNYFKSRQQESSND